ncbi:MAG: hypothetical protein ACK6CT_07995 [Planctomycetia bacterium]|jgi:hypothetical protein
MTRDGLRRLLAWGIVAALLLPVLLVVLLGLAALLDVLGDRTGAIACGRGALIGGIAWIGSLVVSVAANAVLTLVGHDARAGRRRRLRGRRRRVRPEPAVQEQTPTFAAVRSATERASGAG